jgi:hypothetical protein
MAQLVANSNFRDRRAPALQFHPRFVNGLRNVRHSTERRLRSCSSILQPSLRPGHLPDKSAPWFGSDT